MPDRMLHQLRDEICQLADSIISSTARIEVHHADLTGGSGSGWLYTPEIWVTNHHVVDGFHGDLVLSRAGNELRGRVLSSDPATDLAIIQTDPVTDSAPLPLPGRVPALGELCFVFGCPAGDNPDSITMGIVSGRNRRWRNQGGTTIEGVLQIDAATNPGSSGGPVVDVDGQVIGMSVGGRKDMDNISYCIPATTISAILPELVDHGNVERATLGVKVSAVASGGNEETLTVIGVGGSETTFSVGDVLLSIDGTPLRRRADLFRVLDRTKIDKDVEVLVRRGDDELPVTATARRKDR